MSTKSTKNRNKKTVRKPTLIEIVGLRRMSSGKSPMLPSEIIRILKEKKQIK